jgi:hypothetical protein
MKKKTNIKTIIRQIVREEVAMAIGEVVNELKQPSQSTKKVSQPKPQKKIVEKKTYSKNSVLNDILNETAQDDEWKTMGGGTYDSSKINQVMASSYGNMMTSDGKPDIASSTTGHSGARPNAEIEKALNKDYSAVMKAIDKKKKGK